MEKGGGKGARRVHPLTVQTPLLYSPLGPDLKLPKRAPEDALNVVA